MKFIKVLSIAALCMMTLVSNMYAVNKVKITLRGENGTNAAVLNILEKSGTSIEFSANTGDEMLNIWAVYNSKQYSSLYAEDIQGVKIAFKGNSNTNYTLNFSNFDGEIKIYDSVEDEVITVENGGSYAFSAEANTDVLDRFIIGAPAPQKDYTRDAATVVGNWYTICVPGGVDVAEYSSVMDVYTVAGYSAEKGLAVDPMTEAMQPCVPYIFQAKATLIEFNYNEEVGAVGPQVGACYLTGTFEDMTTSAVAYVVANNKLNWAAAGTTVPAYRAYLNYPDITDGNFPVANPIYPAPGRKFLPAPKAMPTNLEGATVNGLQNGTYMVNGQLVIVKDGKTFNVLGL